MIGRQKMLGIGLAAALIAAMGAAPALAHGPQGMGWGMMGQGSGWCPMMGGGMGYGMGPGMMGPGMMGGGMFGPGMMGQGVGPGMMMAPGIMGQGMGPGMMGQGMMGQGMMGSQAWESLNVDAVKVNLERWLAWQGNPRLKLGNVAEKDAATITAEIITVDNSLVEKIEVDRRTGMMWPVR